MIITISHLLMRHWKNLVEICLDFINFCINQINNISLIKNFDMAIFQTVKLFLYSKTLLILFLKLILIAFSNQFFLFTMIIFDLLVFLILIIYHVELPCSYYLILGIIVFCCLLNHNDNISLLRTNISFCMLLCSKESRKVCNSLLIL